MTLVKARDIKEDSGSIVFDFKDVAAEAQAMLDAARAEAKRIIEKAKTETQNKQEEVFAEAEKKGMEHGRKKGYEDAYEPARKKGYETGYAEALEKVKEHFELHIHEPLQNLNIVLDYFDLNKKRLIWEAEQSFVLLAVKLAEKVIFRNIELNPEMIKDTVIAALDTVSQTTNVVVRVSPEDISIIEELKGDLDYVLGRFDSVKFQPDANVSRGGCVVLTERGKVDSQIEVQLQRIARDILETNTSLDIGEEDLQQRIGQAIKDSVIPENPIESEGSVIQELADDISNTGEIEEQSDTAEVDDSQALADDPQVQIGQELIQSTEDIEDIADTSESDDSQSEPKRDQATELRKQMENNDQQENQD